MAKYQEMEKHSSGWRYVIKRTNGGSSRRITKGGYKTAQEAYRARCEVLRQLDSGQYVEPTKTTVKSYMENWLEEKRTQVRYNTIKQYEWLTNRHIIPNLGRIELQQLTADHIRSLYSKLQSGEKPLKASSVVHLHHMFRSAMEEAVQRDLIIKNPLTRVKPPRMEQYEHSTWTLEQLQTFMDAARDERYYIAFLLLGFTGCRKGEICVLRWKDVNLSANRLHIRGNLVQKKQGRKENEATKTHRSKRPISMFEYAMEELRRHKSQQDREKELAGSMYQDNGLVVCREDGSPAPYSTIQNQWLRIIKRAGLPRIRIHDLRHTHATVLFEQGVPAKLVSDRLGHSRTAVTQDIYTHVSSEQQDEVADIFGNAYFGRIETKE